MAEIIVNSGDKEGASLATRHPFPVIDFKFRNSGTGTAFLSKYYIEIVNVQIDLTPKLRFQWELSEPYTRNERKEDEPYAYCHFIERDGTRIDINAHNVGWGFADRLEISPTRDLKQLFNKLQIVNTKIIDENEICVCFLAHRDINESYFLEEAGCQTVFYKEQVDSLAQDETTRRTVRCALASR